jgi:hypothetical protein
LGLFASGFSQISIPENRYLHSEGNIGNKKVVVLDLHKYSDSIFGSYYNQVDGVLHFFSGNFHQPNRFKALEKNGDSLIGEFITSNKITGYLYEAKTGNKSTFAFTETDYFGSMPFNAYRYCFTYEYADKPLFPTYHVDLLYLYPEGNQNKLVEDSVQDYIIGYFFGKNIVFNTGDNMLKYLSNQYFQSYTAHYQTNAFDYRSSLLKWFTHQNIRLLFNENFVLTFCIGQNSSSWLAEPVWDKIYFVINLKTGNKITPDAIFVSGYREKLKKMVTEKVQNQFNISTSLQSEGFYKSSITKFDNMFITREGVGFHYNPGGIAPWIFGEIDVFFRYDELKEILLTKGIVYTLVQ